MKRANLLPLVVFTVISLADGSAQALVIDSFTEPTASFVLPGDPPLNVPGEAIGGSRTLESVSGGLGTELTIAFGTLSHRTGLLVALSRVTWDANGAGLGSADLTDGGGADRILLDIANIGLSVDLTITVEDGLAGSATLTLAALAPGAISFLFSDFVGVVDFTDIDSITLEIVGMQPGADLEIDLIGTAISAPEPTTLALLGLGVAGLGFARRRA